MLTIDEFRLLPEEEKIERYKELSEHDRFIWRTTCPIGNGVTVKYTELTMEQRLWTRKKHNEMLSNGDITKEQYEELIKEYPLPEEIDEE